MDLEVAAVEAVVVEDHDRRELDVLMVQRLHRPVERAQHEIERPEGLPLERLQFLAEVDPGRGVATSRPCR